ncbi:hypothetical protein [Chitinophaga tropicalis]|uniref:Uncharacterized protein n=1 Tax=Chitinophaga tropicalis TaxID=2683588 RepID=A0A7K1U4D1_9BACT|nr:hypothetical protein [Chitinophaga tropicalis]MVT09217.1 hypothetical protein [Chitinophaga tropicalis]
MFSVRKIFAGRAEKKEVHAPRIYSVMLTYKGNTNALLKFNMEICRMTVGDNTTQYFQITRSDVMVNDEDTTDHVASDLAAQCGNVLYPLQVQIGQDSTISSVFNHQEILQRWKEKKELLKQYFTGADADSYIEATGNTIEQESTLLPAIKQDLFLTAYCNTLLAGNRNGFKVSYYLFPFETPVTYDVTLTGNRMMNNLQQSGRQENGDGIMEMKYTFYKTHGPLQTLNAQWKAGPLQVMLTATCINSDDHNIN